MEKVEMTLTLFAGIRKSISSPTFDQIWTKRHLFESVLRKKKNSISEDMRGVCVCDAGPLDQVPVERLQGSQRWLQTEWLLHMSFNNQEQVLIQTNKLAV